MQNEKSKGSKSLIIRNELIWNPCAFTCVSTPGGSEQADKSAVLCKNKYCNGQYEAPSMCDSLMKYSTHYVENCDRHDSEGMMIDFASIAEKLVKEAPFLGA